MQYVLDENYIITDVMYIKSDSPMMEANFTIAERKHVYKDLGLGKVEMYRYEGNWAGWIEDEDGTKIEFYLIAGLVESSNSWY